MYALTSLLAGLVFGIGLFVSGMANPAKVLGFLDLFGRWDPSLALVMAGAIAVGGIGYALAGRRKLSLLGAPLPQPAARTIDRRLIVGSVVFGIGWGLGGFCPGPGLVSAAGGVGAALVFTVGMTLRIFAESAAKKRARAANSEGETQRTASVR